MKHFKLKDPGSAITHFIGMMMAMFAATPLILRAMRAPDTVHVISLSIFIVSMILLYAASTTYHTFDLSERTNKILKKLDHCMIFVLIAGSYTPISEYTVFPLFYWIFRVRHVMIFLCFDIYIIKYYMHWYLK